MKTIIFFLLLLTASCSKSKEIIQESTVKPVEKKLTIGEVRSVTVLSISPTCTFLNTLGDTLTFPITIPVEKFKDLYSVKTVDYQYFFQFCYVATMSNLDTVYNRIGEGKIFTFKLQWNG